MFKCFFKSVSFWRLLKNSGRILAELKEVKVEKCIFLLMSIFKYSYLFFSYSIHAYRRSICAR